MEATGDGFTLDGHGATLTGSSGITGVHVGPFAHVTIKNLKIQGLGTGISCQGSSQLTLSNVTISGCGTGILLDKTPEGQIQGVQVHGCGEGVHISGSNKQIVEKCDFSENKRIGLSLDSCTNSVIRDNRINTVGDVSKGVGTGLLISNSSHSQILRNTIVRCAAFGISVTTSAGSGSTDNTLDANDVSWTVSGVGLNAESQSSLKVLDCTAGFCKVGMSLSSCTDALLKGDLFVGNTESGLEQIGGTSNVIDTNVFVKENGGPIALRIVGPISSATGLRVFRNIFQDYLKPVKVENASPVTLQSNLFPGAKSVEADDLVTYVGKKPLVLDSLSDQPKGLDFVPSSGPVAPLPTVYDRIGGITVSSSSPGDFDLIVEGSLTGNFQGEEEVIARYRGELPVDVLFPPRFEAQVRVRVAGDKPMFMPFLALLGDNSIAKDMPADDSADTLFVPGFAVSGDLTTRDHFWKPAKGRAGEWWEVDLKRTENLNAFSVLARVDRPDSFWEKFHIAVSTTGLFQGEETVLVTEPSFSHRPGPNRVYRFAATQGRYVRVYGDVDQENVGLQSFGVYGIRH